MKTIQRSLAEPEAENTKAPRRSRVSGMDRALQILDHLYTTGEPAGSYAIAKAIGAPLSTVYVIIDELVERDMLSRRPEGLIWLGPRLYHYGVITWSCWPWRTAPVIFASCRRSAPACHSTGQRRADC
jgi:DNA-binding IclR family transcriptional regulator